MGWLSRIVGKEAAESPVVRASMYVQRFERVSVVGESHYQEALLAISRSAPGQAAAHECLAELAPEPSNPHDPNAIMVQIDGQCVGYLSRADAVNYGPTIRAMLEAGQPPICTAFVGCKPETGNPNLGVALDFPVGT